MNQIFLWVEGAEKGAEMGHRPINPMTRVATFVAMPTLEQNQSSYIPNSRRGINWIWRFPRSEEDGTAHFG
jgi:hypothetical protein